MRWIIGDIHGMLRPLEALVAAIDRIDPQRQLLFVGDYVNRGPDSRGVIDFLLALPQAHFVRGNHDDVFDEVLCGTSYCGKPGEENRLAAFQWFMQHGLDKTFHSYGVGNRQLSTVLRRPTAQGLDELAQAVPPEHRRFIRQLPVVLETDDTFVAHARWDPYLPTANPPISQRLATSEPARYSLLWGRYRADEIEAEKNWAHVGYFGHTPVDSYLASQELLPVLGPQVVLLDTAAALVPHGRLTAFCHETQQFIQADAQGRLITA